MPNKFWISCSVSGKVCNFDFETAHFTLISEFEMLLLYTLLFGWSHANSEFTR